ncbi:MAG TPA: carboxymuconolactone decarboxylase family protein [Phycisphaerae bacterium]
MQPRLNYLHLAPEAYKLMIAMEEYLHHTSIPQPLLNLVKLRASQVNGCAYCIDMHWKDLRATGETEMRLYGLDAWRESPYYTEKERAALEWTESVTLIKETHAGDGAFAALRAHFTDKEIVDLSFAIATINSWNRLAIGFRATPGQYRSPLNAQPQTM